MCGGARAGLLRPGSMAAAGWRCCCCGLATAATGWPRGAESMAAPCWENGCREGAAAAVDSFLRAEGGIAGGGQGWQLQECVIRPPNIGMRDQTPSSVSGPGGSVCLLWPDCMSATMMALVEITIR